MNWHVYIILCSDNSLYTGITTDPERRFQQHAKGEGAKYFRARKPLSILYLEGGHSRSSAGKREAEIKSASRAEKIQLVKMNSASVEKIQQESDSRRNAYVSHVLEGCCLQQA